MNWYAICSPYMGYTIMYDRNRKNLNRFAVQSIFYRSIVFKLGNCSTLLLLVIKVGVERLFYILPNILCLYITKYLLVIVIITISDNLELQKNSFKRNVKE